MLHTFLELCAISYILSLTGTALQTEIYLTECSSYDILYLTNIRSWAGFHFFVCLKTLAHYVTLENRSALCCDLTTFSRLFAAYLFP